MKKILKIIAILVVFFIGFVIIANRGGNHPSQPVTPISTVDDNAAWEKVRATDVAVAEAGWKKPVRLAVSEAGGWEDSANITRDGKKLYFVYYPGDLITDVSRGTFKSNLKTYVSEFPFTTKSLANKYYLAEETWSSAGLMIAENGDFYYNSNRNYLTTQKPDNEVYRNNELLPFSKGKSYGNPHYCATRDELWIGDNDEHIFILKDAAKNNFTGTPQLAPSPINAKGAASMQPFLTSDCNTMYFASNRGDVTSKGPAIYRTTRGADGSWSTPLPIIYGKTGVGEPTLTADGKQLYFLQLFKNSAGALDADLMMMEKE